MLLIIKTNIKTKLILTDIHHYWYTYIDQIIFSVTILGEILPLNINFTNIKILKVSAQLIATEANVSLKKI